MPLDCHAAWDTLTRWIAMQCGIPGTTDGTATGGFAENSFSTRCETTAWTSSTTVPLAPPTAIYGTRRETAGRHAKVLQDDCCALPTAQ